VEESNDLFIQSISRRVRGKRREVDIIKVFLDGDDERDWILQKRNQLFTPFPLSNIEKMAKWSESQTSRIVPTMSMGLPITSNFVIINQI
jgi:hypothetical protein